MSPERRAIRARHIKDETDTSGQKYGFGASSSLESPISETSPVLVLQH